MSIDVLSAFMQHCVMSVGDGCTRREPWWFAFRRSRCHYSGVVNVSLVLCNGI